MAWIEARRRKDGTVSWWVRDIRGGRQVCIPAFSKGEAELKLEHYLIRKDLEKEGYDDQHQDLLDDLWGSKEKILRKAGLN